jgi:peptidoglycan/xylan/chitin deacetylase (PgdA/CDA1 family)
LKIRVFRPFFFKRWFYREALFRIKTNEKVLCLTFDDGPDPISTPTLLEILKKHHIKAIFFCNGRAVLKYPDLINLIKSDGHLVGNHGFSHYDGLFTPSKKYLEDINLAVPLTSDKLFRPPYGRLKIRQYRKLINSYKIILWDVMAYDFDSKFGKDKSLTILKKKIRTGSVIVLHDDPSGTVLEFIEDFLLYAKDDGYQFDLPVFLKVQPV